MKSLIGFIAASAIRGLSIRDKEEWKQQVATTAGKVIQSGNNLYIATSSGTTGQIKPVHIAGQASDGGVVWLFVETRAATYNNASALYVGIGEGERTHYMQKVNHTNCRLGIKYKAWSNGMDVAENDTVVSGNSVFVVAVGGTSTVEPTDTAATNIMTSDGIVWRYAGEIHSNDTRFVTDKFIPLSTIAAGATRGETWTAEIVRQEGKFTVLETAGVGVSATVSPAGELSAPWVSQPTTGNTEPVFVVGKNAGATFTEEATATATVSNGAITGIDITAGGRGYTNAIVLISGNGTGATATAQVDSIGTITSIQVTAGGQDYTTAQVHIIPGDAGALFKVTPRAVSAADQLNTLDADVLLINVAVDDIPGYVDSSTRYDTTRLLAKAGNMLPRHLGGQASTATNKADGKELLLWETSFAPRQRSAGQQETITIEIEL